MQNPIWQSHRYESIPFLLPKRHVHCSRYFSKFTQKQCPLGLFFQLKHGSNPIIIPVLGVFNPSFCSCIWPKDKYPIRNDESARMSLNLICLSRHIISFDNRTNWFVKSHANLNKTVSFLQRGIISVPMMIFECEIL